MNTFVSTQDTDPNTKSGKRILLLCSFCMAFLACHAANKSVVLDVAKSAAISAQCSAGKDIELSLEGCSDSQLHAVAESLIQQNDPLSIESISESLRNSGSDLPWVFGRSFCAEEDSVARAAQWVASSRDYNPSSFECGFSHDETRLVVLLTHRRARLLLDGSMVTGSHDPALKHPFLAVLDDRGMLFKVAIAQDASQWRQNLPNAIQSVARIQLIAEDEHGPRPFSDLRVRKAHLQDSDPMLYSHPRIYVSKLRERHQAPDLRANGLLDRVASAYATELEGMDEVTHVGLDGADPQERLLRAGVAAQGVGEALACSSNLSKAFGAIANSPAHRITLVNSSYTDIGIGTSVDGAHCVAIVLARWPHAVAR